MLNDAVVKEQYQVKILIWFAALEDLDDNVYINRIWENIGENIKNVAKLSPGLYDLKRHKPCFDEECST
jgi:hypothetical protein